MVNQFKVAIKNKSTGSYLLFCKPKDNSREWGFLGKPLQRASYDSQAQIENEVITYLKESVMTNIQHARLLGVLNDEIYCSLFTVSGLGDFNDDEFANACWWAEDEIKHLPLDEASKNLFTMLGKTQDTLTC